MDGETVQHIEYVSFGEVFIEEHNNKWNTPYLFNAKELDEETGLYYYGARYYDPRITLWLSTDPLQEKYPNISTYMYCFGNPIIYFDPNGMDGWKRVWGAVRLLGGTVQIIGGVGLLITPEPTMLTKAGGVIAVTHGADDFLTGWKQLWSGEEGKSLTQQGVQSGLEAVGVEKETAENVATGVDVLASFAGGGIGAFKTGQMFFAAGSKFSTLSRASDFGFGSYAALRASVTARYGKGSGLHVHHLFEQRFANILGQKADDMISIVVTPAEHKIFTNAWRARIGYDVIDVGKTVSTTSTATKQQILDAAKEIYKDYPEILKALGIN